STTRRGPNRSTRKPCSGDTRTIMYETMVTARGTCTRDQPNSASIGGMNGLIASTAITLGPNARPTFDAKVVKTPGADPSEALVGSIILFSASLLGFPLLSRTIRACAHRCQAGARGGALYPSSREKVGRQPGIMHDVECRGFALERRRNSVSHDGPSPRNGAEA